MFRLGLTLTIVGGECGRLFPRPQPLCMVFQSIKSAVLQDLIGTCQAHVQT